MKVAFSRLFLRVYGTLMGAVFVIGLCSWLLWVWVDRVYEQRSWHYHAQQLAGALAVDTAAMTSFSQSPLASDMAVLADRPVTSLGEFSRYRIRSGEPTVEHEQQRVVINLPVSATGSDPESDGAMASVLSITMPEHADDIWKPLRAALAVAGITAGPVAELAATPVRIHSHPDWMPVLVGLFACMLLALAIYGLIARFEDGLNHLDQVTQRLAQGHLSARASARYGLPVANLANSYNRMADHIQRLIGIQREMLRAVSHELRTPVARLRFGVQMLEDEAEQPFIRKQLEGMDSDLHELDQLIDEILTYARLEEGGPLLEFQPVDIEDIARQVVDESQTTARVQVQLTGSGVANRLGEAEPRYLHRALQNLVGNACRYAHSQVRVSCSFTEDSCRIDVEDDGPGIPEDQWAKVFIPFARLDDSRTRSSGGYGLGLSIVRRITYWHGGRALVGRSEMLGGAQFSLLWPRHHQD